MFGQRDVARQRNVMDPSSCLAPRLVHAQPQRISLSPNGDDRTSHTDGEGTESDNDIISCHIHRLAGPSGATLRHLVEDRATQRPVLRKFSPSFRERS